MRAKRLRLFTILILFLSNGFLGCNEMDRDPSLLEGPRILAVQMDPRAFTPGTEHTLTALTYNLEAPLWSACPTPFVPDDTVSCPVEIPNMDLSALGSGLSISLSLPAEIPVTQLWVKLRAEDETILPVVFRLEQDAGEANPRVTDVTDDEGTTLNGTEIKIGTTIEVHPILEDPIETGRLTATFFTNQGSFDPHKTFDGVASSFKAPDEPGPVQWIILVRDGDEAVGWAKFEVEVVP
jgi:hypothetical protein